MKRFLAVVLEVTMKVIAKIAFCKRTARHGIAFPLLAVIGLAAMSLLNCVAPGQVVVSGSAVLSGNVQLGSGFGGGPLTYSARTDNCVTGSESGCIGGRTVGQAGSALTFKTGISDPLPFLRLDDGTSPAVQNTSFTDPDFGSYSIFASDQTTKNNTSVFGIGTPDNSAFALGNPTDILISFDTSGGNQVFLHFNETRFLAHGCSPSTPCVITSNVASATCSPSATNYAGSPPSGPAYCTHTQTPTGANTMSRDPADPPNTVYELYFPGISANHGAQVFKDTFTTGSTPGVNDSVSRTLYVDFASDAGGTIPCSVLPSDYQSTWSGVFTVSNEGAFTIASGGGGSYQSLGAGPQSVTPDTFIMPVNNLVGGSNGATFMFQASSGTTSGTEPLWGTNCATQGSTCTDGSVTWTNIGKVNGQGPGFDVLYFNPNTGSLGSGCSYINTRRGKMHRGTNQGTNWPSTGGTAGASGQLITNDAVTCYRMGGTNCGSSGTVNFTDLFTVHDSEQKMQTRYGSVAPTGSGGKNQNYTGGGGTWPEMSATPNGSCSDNASYTNFQTWPNPVFVPGNSYTNGKRVASPVDHNYYKLTGTTGTYTADPSLDAANWTVVATYCYLYTIDWTSNLVFPADNIGPQYNGGGHATKGYNVNLRGSNLFTTSYTAPNCPSNNGSSFPASPSLPLTPPPPYCSYVGAPNPGVQVVVGGLPSDYHGTWLNDGTLDLQPAFLPTDPIPAWNIFYTSYGYAEILAAKPDGSQTIYRMGHDYNTHSNSFYDLQDGLATISADGKVLLYPTDAMNTRGDSVTGSATCANPLRAYYQPASGTAVTLNDYVLPLGNNTGGDIYKITNVGSGTEGALPNWNTSCPSLGNTCTDANGVVFTNQGPNTCRGDMALMDVTSAHPLTGNTINAASCSSANVLSAIASASTGDTVVVPSGTCTWTTPSLNTPTITLTKSITLQGATTCSGSPVTCVDGTIINDGTTAGYDENLIDDNANNSRITGFSFKDPRNLSDAKYPVQLSCTGCRFDHNSVTQANVAGATHGIYVFSSVSGTQLVDHNYFANLNGAADVDGSASDTNFGGDTSWSTTLTPGSPNATYIESNNFTCDYAAVACPLDGAYDAYAGARLVFRFNNLTNYNIGGHGLDSGGLRSTLLQEVYNNTFTTPGTHIYTAMGTRGGTHMIFNNTINASGGSYDAFLWLQEYRSSSGYSWGSPTGALCGGSPTNNIDSNASHGWICRDQVGRGPETAPSGDWPVNTSSPTFSEASFPGYQWGNLFKGVAPTTANINVCDAVPNCSTSNATVYQVLNSRDFYMEAASFDGTSGTGTGSLASRPSTCTTGVAYWATDQGTWNLSGSGGQGVLYKCTSTNTWTLYYTPYTYPHPLQ